MTDDDSTEQCPERPEGVEPTTVFGYELPDGTEDKTARDGILSAVDEWHALLLGAVVGGTGSLLLITLFVAFLLGEFDGMRRNVSHIRDALSKPAYTGMGMAVGVLGHVSIWGPPASMVI